MTNIKFKKNNDKFCAVECSGHCGYDDYGKDIVCAAASSIVQTAVLGIISLVGVGIDYKIDEKIGNLKAVLPEKLSASEEHDCDLILRTAFLGLSDLVETYSDYINLEVE